MFNIINTYLLYRDWFEVDTLLFWSWMEFIHHYRVASMWMEYNNNTVEQDFFIMIQWLSMCMEYSNNTNSESGMLDWTIKVKSCKF